MTGSLGSLRALVLSAGRGERLRPLTDTLPKPLLPVLGKPVGERTLSRLAAAGVTAAAVNIHHLGAQIRQRLGASLGGMQINYSVEKTLLGTLGSFGRLQGFFVDVDPVLLVNGDSLCRWPIAAVLRAHRASGVDVTLLLSAHADVEEYGGGVVTDSSGRVLSFRGDVDVDGAARRGVFAGLHVIAGTLLRDVPAHPADIVRQLYEPLLESGGVIRGVYTGRRWHDLGMPLRYLRAVLEEAEASVGGSWLADGLEMASGAAVERSVIESGVRVEAGARVEGSLLLEGARVGRGAELVDTILAPGTEIPAHHRIEGQLVTRLVPEMRLRSTDRVLGNRVHTPINDREGRG